MNLNFDKQYWLNNLQHPDWYIRLEPELKEKILPIVKDDKELKKFRSKIYELIGSLLVKDKIPLATKGPNFDRERKPIDIIVIHHTAEDPNLKLDTLNAIGFIRQYAKDYLANDLLGNNLRGQAIWSGHFWKSRQVFFAYHWLIRPDGEAQRLLEDKYIGWHAGDWKANIRSVGIALSGDYEYTSPPLKQSKATAEVIKKYYSKVEKKRLFGHREVKGERTCPGEKFIPEWKQKLLNLL